MRARTTAELAEIFAAYQDAGADRIDPDPDTGDWSAQLEQMIAARAMLT